MSANDFQRAYNAFSGVNIKMRENKMEVDPEVAKAAKPWVNKALLDVIEKLVEKGQAEIPGMKGNRKSLEYSLMCLIKAWAELHEVFLARNVPLRVYEEFNPPYPLKQLSCCICGKEKCEHLQTEVIDAFSEDADNSESADG